MVWDVYTGGLVCLHWWVGMFKLMGYGVYTCGLGCLHWWVGIIKLIGWHGYDGGWKD